MNLLKQPKYKALAVATGLLAINFWAWSLISPLASQYAEQFTLSPIAVSALVAAPVLIGSLGRIPVGLLADRYGGRKIFALVCLLSSVAVMTLAASHTYSAVLGAAVLLGVGGASFAVGVPFVSAWFAKNERGLALGIYAIGNAGTALSGLATPHLVTAVDRTTVFVAFAVILLAAAVLMMAVGRDSPQWRPASSPALARLKQALAWRLTWRLSVLYAITFGAFVALGLYLPLLLNQSYGLTATDSAMRAAGFVLLATAARPLGGLLSDRLSGVVVVRYCFMAVFIFASIAAVGLPLAPVGTLAYLGLAASLGAGNGAIFAILGYRCEEKLVGTVSGLIGAAGGLGGFFPPLLMGVSFQLFHSYAPALFMLAAVAAIICLSVYRLIGARAV